MRNFPIKNDFPHDFYDEFARFVIAFGRLEYLIKLCVKNLLGQGFAQGMATAEGTVQFRDLCKKAIAELKKSRERLDQVQFDAFSKLIEDAVEVAEYRNDTIHAAWTTDSNGQPMRIRPKKGTDGKNSPVNWERSRVVLVTEIREQRNRSERLYEDLDMARGTWPKAAT